MLAKAVRSRVRYVRKRWVEIGARGGWMDRLRGRKREGEEVGARGGEVSGGRGEEERVGGWRVGGLKGGSGGWWVTDLEGGRIRGRLVVGEEVWVGDGELEARRRFAFEELKSRGRLALGGVGWESGITQGSVAHEEVSVFGRMGVS